MTCTIRCLLERERMKMNINPFRNSFLLHSQYSVCAHLRQFIDSDPTEGRKYQLEN